MPRFMGFVKMEEGIGAPPQAMFDAMDKYIGEQAAKGVFLDGGGLFGTEDAVNFVVRKGETSRVDGPYAEAKEVVGGWSLLQYDSLEQAVAAQEEFAELHAEHWPEFDPSAAVEATREVPVQVNGKLRDKLIVPTSTDAAALERLALDSPKILAILAGRTPDRVISPGGKLVNIVLRDG